MHLYNNFKIVEQKVKRTVAGNNDDKNLAFLTTSSPSSTNTINTVNHGVSTGTTKGRKNLKRFFLEENTDAQLLLKIWVSVDEDDVEDLSYRNRKVQLLCYLAVIPMLTLESSNSQLNDKGFVDSGCSRHMSGNIAHLSDFKDFDGGYVTFGGGAIVGRLHWSIPLLYKNSLGDHPIDHVIGDVQSSVQTRRMTTSYSELGFLGAIYEGKTHHDLHTCLVSYSRRTKDEFLKLFLVILLGAIGTKWVYRNKKDERGIVVRNKARLVGQGHTQEEGAVIYGQIEEEHPELDDIIFGSTKKELCDEFEKLMKDKFQMSSMGELTFFLGLQVQQKKKGIFISQDKYVHEILKKFNYTDVKSDDWDLYVSYTHLDKISCLQFVHVQVSLITMIVDYAGATLDRKSNHWRTSDLTSQEQTATGKDFSNPYIVGSLLKLIEVGVPFIKTILEVLLMKALTDGNGDVKINATIDGHSLSITEGSLRRHLKLDDQDGITSLPTTEIFAQLGLWAMLLDQIVIFQNSELSLNGVPISFDVPRREGFIDWGVIVVCHGAWGEVKGMDE
ncbi:alpha/beta hydrolases superfamily protein [Tanacetum coccineum]